MSPQKGFFVLNWRKILYSIICVLFIFFIINSKSELFNLKNNIQSAKIVFVFWGAILSLTFIFLQSYILKLNMEAVGGKIPFQICLIIYLKRFFISTFIPVGFSASQYTFTSRLESFGLQKSVAHLASTFYLFSGIISYLIISIPTIVYLTIYNQSSPTWGIAIILFISVTCLLYIELNHLLNKKGYLFNLLKNKFPKIFTQINQIYDNQINYQPFFKSIIISLLSDILGATFILFSALAFGQNISFFHCLASYVISLIILTISPIFQGLILFEVSMAYTLNLFGISEEFSFATVIIYRLFQLWIPFLLGSFLVARTITKKYKEKN